MFYYIINNRIIEYAYELDASLYAYDKLNTEQSLFYEQNPNASLPEVLAMELTPPSIKTLENYRNEKYQVINDDFNTAVANGYYDTVANITIKIEDYDRNQFNQRITLINLLSENSKPETVVITDINGEPHTLALMDFYRLMLYMGMYYDSLWAAKVNKDKQVKDATTIEEINLI